MTLAKGLGSGLPISAVTGRAEIMDAPAEGGIGGTYGGNPVACAAALAAVRALADPALLANVRTVGAHFRARLDALAPRSGIRQVRGMGLMLGVELDRPGGPVVDRCRDAGLLINCTADRILRFLPPLVITREQVDEGFTVLERALAG
jgi:acetylornithine/succinyldiaminopimelate/putrescine aminotransferase